MPQAQNLFNQRAIKNFVDSARWEGVVLPEHALSVVHLWAEQIDRGVIDRLTESQVEQTFNEQIFCKVLGYRQIGESAEASLMPKTTGDSGRDTPDFILGRFDPAANIDKWAAVGEVKDSRTDLDQPQLGRANKETPVEQAFRCAIRGRPGTEWILVSNFREIRLYRNGYANAYHRWHLRDLRSEQLLYEFYCLLRPTALIDSGQEPFTTRLFKESISAGRELTEGFYGLYKLAQQKLIQSLAPQQASKTLTIAALYGKTHKLLNRILFAAFCEHHPAGLLTRGALRSIWDGAQRNGASDGYWRAYRQFFDLLNQGGGKDGIAYNAFNAGLFAHDPYFDNVVLANTLFTQRLRFGQGKRKSLEINGVFGFDVYDFTNDLNAEALGAIFEQSLKDIITGSKLVRGFGEIDVSTQKVGGVYYTPREITSYMVKRALEAAVEDIRNSIQDSVKEIDVTPRRIGPRGRATASDTKREILLYDRLVESLKEFKLLDPACGSGAFLVEGLQQLQSLYEKTNMGRYVAHTSSSSRSATDWPYQLSIYIGMQSFRQKANWICWSRMHSE